MRRHLAIALICLLFAAGAQAATLFVGVGYPYATIQAAINAASPGDIVQVTPGTYTDFQIPTPGDSCVVAMKSGITLRGAGPSATIISGAHVPNGIRGIHCDGVTNAVIEELTVRDCGHASAVKGSAILCRNGSSPTIRNCVLTRNHDGGIICYQNSSPIISNVSITFNSSKEGGGIALDGISNGGAAQIIDCIIADNKAPGGGGLFMRAFATPTIRNTIILRDSIDISAGFGGGVSINSASPIFDNCFIENCRSTAGGGGVYQTGGNSSFTNCLIRGNHTLSDGNAPGGGIMLDSDATMALQGCTIVRNFVDGIDPTLDDGGGIAVKYATFNMNQCTVAYNGTAAGLAGGIYVAGYSTVSTITKSIIAFNSPGAGMYCFDTPTSSVGCTDLYGNAGGNTICATNLGHNFSLNPLFCNAATDDFRLDPSSPCGAGHHPDGATACDGSRLGSQNNGCTPVSGVEPSATPAARLFGNAPNPFRPWTVIQYELAQPGQVSLAVFDVGGRQVRVLESGMMEAGSHSATWDGRDEAQVLMPAGIYFVRLNAAGAEWSRPMVMTR
jgi:hypothetical protein